MSWIEALVLGVVQGITEFLPISSDGHLALFQHVFASRRGAVVDGGESLFFNVMLHLGTLAAILLYYRATARDVVQSTFDKGKPAPVYTRATLFKGAFLAGVATLPAVVVGLTMKDWVESATANPWIAAAGFLVTATALSAHAQNARGNPHAGTDDLGTCPAHRQHQALAILPGVSRSGMTISTALALGFTRPWAVGFSLLMAVPAITGAGILELKELDPSRLSTVEVQQILAATLVSAVVGIRGGRSTDSRCTGGLALVFFCIPSNDCNLSFRNLHAFRSTRNERAETPVDRLVPSVAQPSRAGVSFDPASPHGALAGADRAGPATSAPGPDRAT